MSDFSNGKQSGQNKKITGFAVRNYYLKIYFNQSVDLILMFSYLILYKRDSVTRYLFIYLTYLSMASTLRQNKSLL